MIRGFEPSHPLEPEQQDHLQWVPALEAGLIAGAVLLVLPQGSPWSSLSFFSPAILGRRLPEITNMPILLVWAIHSAISMAYGLVISRVVAGIGHQRAILAGGVAGLALYLVNFVIISSWWPELRGNEVAVTFSHLVFGLLVAGAYRGLLKRRAGSFPPAD